MFEFFPGHYRWSYNTLLAFAAGGQIGDVEMVWRGLRQKVGDDAAWHAEWEHLARVLERRAESSLGAHAKETASENYYLASLYHTIGEHFIPPSDPARLASYAEVLRTFERARTLSSWPVERVVVPFAGQGLPAYFMPSLVGSGPRPAVIFICGLDTTKELSYLRVRRYLAERGMHCLAIDTPGIGEALRLRGLYTRHDYEVPVRAAVDYLVSRADVDSSRIGIIGSSLGGYYVSRAAAYEPRIRAVVAWGTVYDYHEVWRRRLTVGGTLATPSFQLMYITGTSSIEDAVERVSQFSVAPFGELIRCPFLLLHGKEDQQVPIADAHAMFEAIGSVDKELKICTGEDAGSAHCQFDNHMPAMQYVADWLRRKLSQPGDQS